MNSPEWLSPGEWLNPGESQVPKPEPTFYVVCKTHGNITSSAMDLQPYTSRVICPHCLCDWLGKAFPAIPKEN